MPYISKYSNLTETECDAAYKRWKAAYDKKLFDLEAFHQSVDKIFEELWSTDLFADTGYLKPNISYQWYPRVQDVLDAFTSKFSAERSPRYLMFRLMLSSLYGTQFKGKRYVCSKFINEELKEVRSLWEPVKKVRPVEELKIIPEDIYEAYAVSNRHLPRNEFQEYYNLIEAKDKNKSIPKMYLDPRKTYRENVIGTMQRFMNGFMWEKLVASILDITLGTSHELTLTSTYKSREGSTVAAPDLLYKDLEIECKVYENVDKANDLLVKGCHRTKVCLCYLMDEGARAWAIVENNLIKWYRYKHQQGLVGDTGDILPLDKFNLVYEADKFLRDSGWTNNFKVYKIIPTPDGGANFSIIHIFKK